MDRLIFRAPISITFEWEIILRNALFLILLVSFFPLFSAGQGKSDSHPSVFTLKDSYGREVQFSSFPSRVVSTAPNITEIIFALGAEDLLVGRTEYCDYPEAVFEIPTIGGLQDPNLEAILALNPDVVIGSSHFKKSHVEALEAVGIPVVVLMAEDSFDGVYQVIGQLAQLLERSPEGEVLIGAMKEKVLSVQQRLKGITPQKVYYVVGYGQYGDFTAGGDTFIGQLITMAGGVNIAQDVKGWAFSLEKIIQEDPEVLICSQYRNTKKNLMQAEGYKDLSAVREGRLFTIDNNLLERHGPRIAQGLENLAKLLHPEAFP